MGNMIAVVRRELGAYFISPMAYIILTAILFASGLVFYFNMIGYAQNKMPATLTDTTYWLVFLLTLVCPLVTMRLIAEEKSRGTIETLMTAPLSEWQFVVGKYLAALLFVGYLLLPTVFYAAFVAAYGRLDYTGMAAGYLGVMLTIGAVLAIGLFVSALSANQITAGVVTLIVAIMLMLVSMGTNIIRPTSDFIRIVRDVLGYVGILNHVEQFSRGVIDTRPLVYLLTVIVLFLYGTIRAVESRRWR